MHTSPPVDNIFQVGETDWWLSEFTDAEREHIKAVFKPALGGPAIFATRGPVGSLTDLTGWFDNPKDRYLALKIARRAMSLITDRTKAEDAHFAYAQFITIRYKDRKTDPTAIDDVAAACERMVAIAPRVARAMHRENKDLNDPVAYVEHHSGGPLTEEEKAIIKNTDKDASLVEDRLPSHLGYWRLIHIKMDQGRYAEALSLMQQSESQGWSDDYSKLEVKARSSC